MRIVLAALLAACPLAACDSESASTGGPAAAEDCGITACTVVSDDDFANETADQEVRAAVAELVAGAPVVFTSRDKAVRILDIRPLLAGF